MHASSKRLLSIVLSLVMVLAMLPMAVFAETPEILYLQPNSNWTSAGARFAAYFYGNGDTWLDCTDDNGDGVYEVAVPEGYTSVIFCRMNPDNTANGWDTKWNQTSDLAIPTDSTNCYVVEDGSWDKGNGQWITYTVGGEIVTEPVVATYYVAGDFNEWNPADSNYLMSANLDGTYSLTLSMTQGTYNLKVTDGSWSNCWGDGSGNYVVVVESDCNVTIGFDPTSGTITATGDSLGEEEKEPLAIYSVHLVGVAGLAGVDWDPSQNQMSSAMGVYSITFTGIAAGTYEYKFAANSAWDITWGTGAETVSGETYALNINGGNSTLNVAEDNSTVTVSLDMTAMDIVTGEGAACTVVVESAGTPDVPATTLVLGDNALSLADGDVDGEIWTYTATEDGTLTIDVTALSMDDGTGVLSEVPAAYISMVMSRNYSTQINGVSVYGFPYEQAVTAGDVVAVQIYSGMGTATEMTMNLTLGEAQEVTPAEPGTMENPIVIESLPYEITVEGEHDLYYSYTAAEDQTLVIIYPEGNYVSGLPNYENDEEALAYTVEVAAGETISINPWGTNEGTYVIDVYQEEVVENVTVYFDNSLYNWANVYAYAWNDDGSVSEGWPGTAMTQNEDGTWSIQLPETAANVIFNDGIYQTSNLTFAADTIYNGIASAAYGNELNTNFYVTGSGKEFGNWAADHAAGLMTNNGDGTFSVTINNVNAAGGDYEYKITAGNWEQSWGDPTTGGNFTVTVEALSDVTVIFNLNTQTASATTEAIFVQPTIVPQYPTLSLEDMVVMNVYYSAANLDCVVEMGLITYSQSVEAASIETAEKVIPGYAWSETDGLYYSSSTGIAAKNLGDTIYFAVYAMLTDGSYCYSSVLHYSPKTYAYNQLASDNEAMKPMMVALLNYGAAAQTYFGCNTDALINADLTADDLSLVESYSASMMTAVTLPDDAKKGEMVGNGGYSKRYPTVSFEGAFSINYYFTPSAVPVGDITMYVWNQADFDAAESLRKGNATESITMTLTESGEYVAVVGDIVAKDLDQGVYVSFCYYDGTTDYCSGVVGYSIGAYCVSQSAGTGTIADLASACAVYGYYAKQFFA